ncbi:hypothetical protein JKP88DRAFT_171473 [Tribonema minus]|uniref:Cell division control protein n=1 Tax=Tribonema minus TaxID=303371 RepID=A0A835YIZ8_9STRA|nr:hypothetical protein JKP88DRAFT_171473 [Tribonema minus]
MLQAALSSRDENAPPGVNQRAAATVAVAAAVVAAAAAPPPPEDVSPAAALQRLSAAVAALNYQHFPEAIPQRAAQLAVLTRYVTDALAERCGTAIYVSGAPGTGKTCTLQQVEDAVRVWRGEGSGSSAAAAAAARPAFVHVDAAFQTSAKEVFQRILEKIPGNVQRSLRAGRGGSGGSSSGDARAQLEAMLAPPDNGSGSSSGGAGGAAKTMLVLTIEEVNYLRGRGDAVLQALFGWACAPNSRLVLIGVANNINLTETADIGVPSDAVTSVLFPTYTAVQLEEILTARAGGVFDPRAAALCAKRVAVRSGDARDALQLAQGAVIVVRKRIEAALASGGSGNGSGSNGGGSQVSSNVAATAAGLVTTRDVSAAAAAIDGASGRSTMGELAPAQKMLLCVIAALRAERCGDTPEVAAIMQRHAGAMLDAGFGTYQQGFQYALDALADGNLVEVQGGGIDRRDGGEKPRFVKLNVSDDDLRAVFTENVFKKVLPRAGGGGRGGGSACR